jgi:hypothetical protein
MGQNYGAIDDYIVFPWSVLLGVVIIENVSKYRR